MTTVPVFGVPVQSKALSGQDSLLSIVQMPAGVPVGTLAIGEAGATNAALLAAAVLGQFRPRFGSAPCGHGAQTAPPLLKRCRVTRELRKPGATIGIIGGGQLGPNDVSGRRRFGVSHGCAGS